MKKKNNIITAVLATGAIGTGIAVGTIAQTCSTGTDTSDNQLEIVNDLNFFSSPTANAQLPQTQIGVDFAQGMKLLVYDLINNGETPTDDDINLISFTSIYINELTRTDVVAVTNDDDGSTTYTISISELIVTSFESFPPPTDPDGDQMPPVFRLWNGTTDSASQSFSITASLNSITRPQINTSSFVGTTANTSILVEIPVSS